MKSQLPIEEVFSYDPISGHLYWKINVGQHGRPNKIAGSINGKGYIKIQYNGVAYLAHRIAFYLMTGRWPTEIDHINRIRNDNRWCNLREVSRSDNMLNRKEFLHKSTKNKLGVKGVTKTKFGTYEVTGRYNKYLGTSKTLEGAKQISENYWNEQKERLQSHVS